MDERTEPTDGRPRRPAPVRGSRRARTDDGYNLFIHIFIMLMCAGVIVASVILEPGAEAVSLFGQEIPSTCMFRNLTGIRCFGCGLTRSFTYVGHGQLLQAFGHHIVGPVLYLFVAGQVPYRVIRIVRWVRERRARVA